MKSEITIKKLKAVQYALFNFDKSFQTFTIAGIIGVYLLLVGFKKVDLITVQEPEIPVETILREEIRPVNYLVSDKYQKKSFEINDISIHEIRGKVTDTSGVPLRNVSVVVKGKPGVTKTDSGGVFTLQIDGPDWVLVFSYPGMAEQEIDVNGLSELSVVMKAIPYQIEDEINTGVYKMNKRSYSGSGVTFTGEQLKSIAPTNIFDALNLVTPGLTKVENNRSGSNPNAMPEVLIRGVSSFENSNQSVNQPLVVRDGTIIGIQDLYDMDINEIAAITVLKDAAAAVLYGVASANGVIVVESKKITSDKLKVYYNLQAGIQFPDFSSYNLLNAADKLEFERVAGLYRSPDNLQQQFLDSFYNARLIDINNGANTNWLRKPTSTGLGMDHSLRLTGTPGKFRYALNARYGSVGGIMKDDYRKRFGIGLTLEYHLSSRLTLSNRTRFSRTGIRYSKYGIIAAYTGMNPYEKAYDDSGDPVDILTWGIHNPLYEAGLGSFSKRENKGLSNDFELHWKMSYRFELTSHFNFTLDKSDAEMYTSPLSVIYGGITAPSQKGSLSITDTKGKFYMGRVVLKYNEVLPKQSLLTAHLGASFNSVDLNAFGITGAGGTYADLRSAIVYPSGSPTGGYQSLNTRLTSFLNLNYLYNNRYYFDGIYQVSGASKFGAEDGYGHFWSAGLGWNLHNENFLKNGRLDIFRLRVNAGYTGKINHDSYQVLTAHLYNISLNYMDGYSLVPNQIDNPNLGWGHTMNYNSGLDLSFFNRRLNFSADVYLRKTKELIIDRILPPWGGVITSGDDNFGEMQNRGIELRLDGYLVKRTRWSWQVGAIAVHNQNKVLKITNSLKSINEFNDQFPTVSPLHYFEEGISITALKVVRSAGIDSETGKEIFIKLNGERTFDYDPSDKIFAGDLQPKLYGNLFSVVSFNRFTIAGYFHFAGGQYIYNTTLATKVEGTNPRYNADYRVFHQRWEKPGDKALFNSISDQSVPQPTTRFVEKENIFSLSRLNLSYEIDRQLLEQIGVNQATVGLNVNELFRFSSAKYERGTDYPFSRGFNFYLSIVF